MKRTKRDYDVFLQYVAKFNLKVEAIESTNWPGKKVYQGWAEYYIGDLPKRDIAVTFFPAVYDGTDDVFSVTRELGCGKGRSMNRRHLMRSIRTGVSLHYS